MGIRIFGITAYSLLFIVDILFASAVDWSKRKNKNKLALIFSFFVILLPCVFAAIRAETVGVDVKVYMKPLFEDAVRIPSLSQLLKVRYDVDIGFNVLAYISTRIFPDLKSFLFFCQLIIILPVYVVAFKNQKVIPVRYIMTVYLLVFYCATFNIVRQSIAAVFIFLAYQYYIEKKYVKVLISVAIACMFHNTAIVGLVMYIASMCIRRIKKSSTQWIVTIVSAFIVIVLCMGWQVVFRILLEKNIFSEKYEMYFDVFSNAENNSSSYFFEILPAHYPELIYRIFFAIVVLIGCKRKDVLKKLPDVGANVFALVIGFSVYLFAFIGMHTGYGVRISWYTEWMLLILIPALMANNKKVNRMYLRNFVIIMILISYFIIGYIGFGWHGVHPLRFSI